MAGLGCGYGHLMAGLGPMSLAEYLRVNERLRVFSGYSQDWAEQLMARRVLVELGEHLAAFQRRRGVAVVPLLAMNYHVRRMWSYEFLLDRAKTEADEKIRHAARRAARVRADAQRRYGLVQPGMWARTRARNRARNMERNRSRTRGSTPALPTPD
jgi:hypothetical protein